MFTAKNIFPLLILGLFALSSSDCKQKPKTEADFIEEEIFSTGMDIRVNGLDDLIYFSALQASNACQQDCGKLKEAVVLAQKNVAEMEDGLFQRIGGIRPPPPPCPCETGNCLWERFAVFSYFVDLTRYNRLPEVSLQTVNGQEISSSAKAEVQKSPEGNYAVVQLPNVQFKDEAVKMIIKTGDGAAAVLVNIK